MRKSDLRVRCVHWLLELSATAGAWCAAAWLVANRIGSSEAAAALHAALRLAPLVLPLAAIAHRAARGREANEPREADWSDLCRAAGLASAIVGAALYQRIDASLLLPTLLLFAGLNALALAAAGRATTLIVKRLAHSGPKPKTLLVGGGRVARRLARTLLSENGPGVELLGYVDSPERPGAGNLARLGTLAEVASLVDRHAIERVFVALPATRYGELPAILRSVSSRAVDVVFAPDVPHLAGLRLDSVAMSGVPLITARAIPDDAAFFALKRVFDAAVAGLLCVLLAPVLGLIALAVKLTSAGPIFFSQSRVGWRGRTFEMYKFRTMRVDAESRTGPVWARRNDDRCTPIGAFLRKWSLDELPQLFNVLRGDMSLVGPRPERPVFVEKFSEQLPAYKWRHQAPVGVTGWAQVNGWRGNTSLRRRLEHDLYYVNHGSLWLDFKILVMTLWCGFRHKNAY